MNPICSSILWSLFLRVATFLHNRVRPILLSFWCAFLVPLRLMVKRRQQKAGVVKEVHSVNDPDVRDPDAFFRIEQVGITDSHLCEMPHTVAGQSLHWKFGKLQRIEPENIHLLILRNGRTCGEDGAIIASDGTLLREYSPCYCRKSVPHPLMQKIHYPPVSEVNETVAVLNYPASDNYFHWLFNVLPRLMVLRRRPDVKIDRYLIDQRRPFQRDALQLLDVESNAIIQPSKDTHVQCSSLIVPSLLRPCVEVCGYLRSSFLPQQPSDAGMSRRLYLTRAHTKRRKITNEQEVQRKLIALGFEIIDPGQMTFSEQVQVFSEAAVVVSAHGAALSNIAFCPRGTIIVEIFSPRYVNVCYWHIANCCQLTYFYLLGKGKSFPEGSDPNGVYDDIDVRIDELDMILRTVN
jgi:hypothetical protein